MKKLIVVAVSAALAVAACGGGDGKEEKKAKTSAFCDKVKDFEKNATQTGQLDSPDAQKKYFERITKEVDKLAAAAPAQIKDDLRIVADGLKKLVANPQDQSIATDEKYTKASENITKFFSTECGVGGTPDGGGEGPPAGGGEGTGPGGEPAPEVTGPEGATAPPENTGN
jgi:hypothetical protein